MFAKNAISIDRDKCVNCLLCVKDCPNGYLFEENGRVETKKNGCIECGHCYAICPQNAVRMNNYDCDNEPATPMTDIPSDTLLSAMKSRRSVRQFTDEPVEKAALDKILEAGRYSPTGANMQDVAYTIMGSRQDELEAECVKMFRKALKAASPLSKEIREREIDDRFFFKGAPLVIVVSAKSSVNAGLASSYMELMAESLGFGVFYSGFFVICSKLNKKIRKMLDLPKGHKVVTCMIIGHPDVKYQRIVPRKKLVVKEL